MPSGEDIFMVDMDTKQMNCPSQKSAKASRNNLWKIPG